MYDACVHAYTFVRRQIDIKRGEEGERARDDVQRICTLATIKQRNRNPFEASVYIYILFTYSV